MENCRQFIVDVLKLKGPLEAHLLLKACTTSAPNCPKALKSSSFDEFVDFLKKEPKFFSIEKEVCLTHDEEKFKNHLLSALVNEGIDNLSLEKIELILTTCGQGTVRYIQAQGIEEFFIRHSDTFMFKDNSVFLVSHCKNVEDQKAVEYFLHILSEKGSLSLSKLSGHWNQASDEVKDIVKSTQPEAFKDFLLRNSFYFKITGGTVEKRASDQNLLPLEIEGDELEQKTVCYFIKKLEVKGSQTLQQLVSLLNHCTDPEIIGTIGSKKPLSIRMFLRKFPSIFLIDNSDKVALLKRESIRRKSSFDEKRSTQFDQLDDAKSRSAKAADANVLDSLDAEDSLRKGNNDESKKNLSLLFGDDFFNDLNTLLRSLNIKDIGKVEMLWFDVGKHPTVKILTYSPKIKYVVHELRSQTIVSVESLQALLNHERVISITTTLYGITGSLHTLRVIWLGKIPVGITLFHQTHLSKTDDKFEEEQLGSMRCILYDRETVSCNSYCSFLRNVSRNLAEHHHVIVVDLNGKITGYDASLPDVVAKARRVSCTSFDHRSGALMEAFSHFPDYIVTNCLDVMDTNVLQTIKEICAQGVQVIVAVHKDYRKLLDVA